MRGRHKYVLGIAVVICSIALIALLPREHRPAAPAFALVERSTAAPGQEFLIYYVTNVTSAPIRVFEGNYLLEDRTGAESVHDPVRAFQCVLAPGDRMKLSFFAPTNQSFRLKVPWCAAGFGHKLRARWNNTASRMGLPLFQGSPIYYTPSDWLELNPPAMAESGSK